MRGGRCRAETREVNKLRAEAGNGFVQHIVNLDDGAQAHPTFQTKLARDVEVEDENAWAKSSIARQVSGLSDGREREGREQCRVERFARLTEV